jgi:hypothetical protein
MRIPDRLAGRRVTCPQCDTVLDVVETTVLDRGMPSSSLEEVFDGKAAMTRTKEPSLREELRGALSRSSGLGALSVFFGLLSILLLCVPFVGLIAIPLGGFGFLLGLGGLVLGKVKGDRDQKFPLAGSAVCLVALALALLPMLVSGSWK